jgi:hypothetical protein
MLPNVLHPGRQSITTNATSVEEEIFLRPACMIGESYRLASIKPGFAVVLDGCTVPFELRERAPGYLAISARRRKVHTAVDPVGIC